jgi:hypothetical protein
MLAAAALQSLAVRRAQVEGNDQMRYLHHRMQSCSEEQELLRRASALAAALEPDTPPPLPLRPLQVAHMIGLAGNLAVKLPCTLHTRLGYGCTRFMPDSPLDCTAGFEAGSDSG